MMEQIFASLLSPASSVSSAHRARKPDRITVKTIALKRSLYAESKGQLTKTSRLTEAATQPFRDRWSSREVVWRRPVAPSRRTSRIVVRTSPLVKWVGFDFGTRIVTPSLVRPALLYEPEGGAFAGLGMGVNVGSLTGEGKRRARVAGGTV